MLPSVGNRRQDDCWTVQTRCKSTGSMGKGRRLRFEWVACRPRRHQSQPGHRYRATNRIRLHLRLDRRYAGWPRFD